jgi:hypothetical protein
MLHWLDEGAKQRVTRATRANATSSRTHAIFSVRSNGFPPFLPTFPPPFRPHVASLISFLFAVASDLSSWQRNSFEISRGRSCWIRASIRRLRSYGATFNWGRMNPAQELFDHTEQSCFCTCHSEGGLSPVFPVFRAHLFSPLGAFVFTSDCTATEGEYFHQLGVACPRQRN